MYDLVFTKEDFISSRRIFMLIEKLQCNNNDDDSDNFIKTLLTYCVPGIVLSLYKQWTLQWKTKQTCNYVPMILYLPWDLGRLKNACFGSKFCCMYNDNFRSLAFW